MANDQAQFLAYLPAIQLAVKWHGSGDSVRFQLEVPRQELAGFLPVLEWTNGMLRVTIEPADVQEIKDASEWN